MAAAAIVALGCAAFVVRPWESRDTTAEVQGPPATATVARTSLSSGLRLSGTLGHGPAAKVVAQGQGIFTRLPASGKRIRAGEVLFEIDARPVVLFTGTRPFWRDLTPGMSDGPDVRQLEQNLTDLGFAEATTLTVDQHFTDATASAVKRWQKSLGLDRTGTIPLGRVIVLPDQVVRVDEVTAVRGGVVAPGTSVLSVTPPDIRVSVRLSGGQAAQLPPGGDVSVALTDGRVVRGELRAMEPEGGGAPGDQDGSGTDERGGAVAIIELAQQKEARAAMDKGRPDVTVTVPDRTVKDALVVPVTALLALADGGYGVRVVRGEQSEPRLISVEVGLIVDARAQITGAVREGQQVVIPT
ncbi:peptidoglycan-binding protein [Streptomyces cavernae]|uniref:peptidoglycan-binding protein n=1 Tax=Streptomyces cavernae TaxID=2259034 RepID=UPI00139156E0|nr:peptidoglycan-binding protein [Streptomyces cavernae]